MAGWRTRGPAAAREGTARAPCERRTFACLWRARGGRIQRRQALADPRREAAALVAPQRVELVSVLEVRRLGTALEAAAEVPPAGRAPGGHPHAHSRSRLPGAVFLAPCAALRSPCLHCFRLSRTAWGARRAGRTSPPGSRRAAPTASGGAVRRGGRCHAAPASHPVPWHCCLLDYKCPLAYTTHHVKANLHHEAQRSEAVPTLD